MSRVAVYLVVFCLCAGARRAHAQESPSPWTFMQDGALFGVVNHQGGPRGGDEFRVPNWWMGMTSREAGSSQLTFTGMFSLDPLTSGRSGYGEIFQVGETLDGRPLVDRQHPHDFVMQLAAVWRRPITESTGFTLAGGPAGEAALGPVAFMHRASAAEYPFATLSHHTFDSTHIVYGVVTAAIDRGPWVIEGSIFNGREPDDHRWDFDFGPLDSVSARAWYRPSDEWELQASVGRLVDPEELEPGIVRRVTASASWLKPMDADFKALTIGYGVNVAEHGTRHAIFAEGTRHTGANSMFFRMEVLEVETNRLLALEEERKDSVAAVTVGAVRDIMKWRGFEGGLGAAATFYAVPPALELSHGRRPVSFQLFFRLRSPAGETGRMWNARMSQPMVGHTMNHPMPH